MTSAKYKAWIRSLPCACCGARRGIEAAHTGPHGLGQKSSDLSCIPLCANHHKRGNDSYHSLGPVKFSARWNLDIPALVIRLNSIGLRGLKLHSPGWPERDHEHTRLHCACGFRTAWYRVESDARATLHHHIEEAEHLQRSRDGEAAADSCGQTILVGVEP